jgi:hypothetical protein
MSSGDARVLDPHTECWDLLPWLVNERLGRAETKRVQAHLAECELCRAELREQQQLRDALRKAEPVVLAPQASLQKLLDRIDADEVPPASERTVSVSSGRYRWGHWLAIAAGLQGLVIAVLLVALWQRSHQELTAPRFTTLSTPTRGATFEGTVIRIVFDPTLSQGQVNALLLAADAQMIAGPSEAGVYTLTLGEDATAATVQAALERLRADPGVRFAELAQQRP